MLIQSIKIKFVLFTALVFCHQITRGQQNYSINLINDSLLVSANAIVRNYTTDFSIKSKGEGKQTIKYAVTIINSNGQHNAIFNEVYHKFKKITHVSGKIFNGKGQIIKELKEHDFIDQSAIAGFSLYEDNRRIYYKPALNEFPYTIEYDFVIEYDGLFYYPTWYPITDYGVSLETASLKIQIPQEIGLKYKEQKLYSDARQEYSGKNEIYYWEISNQIAQIEEPYGLPIQTQVPAVYLAPRRFEIAGYAGDLNTWSDFGAWVAKLIKGTDKLSKKTKTEIIEQFATRGDTLEKIEQIYKYMQSRTRYVNIKLGIGGYKPFDAQSVHDVGYGDCKALTMYTKALLKTVGINSFYTLVLAGENQNDIMVDFPSAQFNHAILCVPLKNDTVWLECTNPVAPFNYCGTFTGDRHVLLITDEGGKLAKTPAIPGNSNVKKTCANFIMDTLGNATGEIFIHYQGIFYDDIETFAHKSIAEQKALLYQQFPFLDFEITDLSLEINKQLMAPEVNLHVKLAVKKFAIASNQRLFVSVNNLSKINLENISDWMVNNRKGPVFIENSVTHIDSLTVTYPTAYSVEYESDTFLVKNDLGKLEFKTNQNKSTVNYLKIYQQNKGEYPAEKISDWSGIIKQEYALDKEKLVLVKE